MRTIKKVLDGRIMIKKLENSVQVGDLTIEEDGESLPLAEVIAVANDIDRVSVGDIIHYTVARESGKCRHNGEEHFIIPISNAVAIVGDE